MLFQQCLLQWIPPDKIVTEFYANWFKEGRERTGFFLVTLPDGAVVAVFPESGEVEYLYIWLSSFFLCHWKFTSEPGETIVLEVFYFPKDN